METLFYLLAIIQILLSAYLVWQGMRWLAYVRRRLYSDPGFYAPRVAVLCPCKGIEPGLERNLVSLTNDRTSRSFSSWLRRKIPPAALLNV